MKRLILVASLLFVSATAFSAWTEETHHEGAAEATARIETNTGAAVQPLPEANCAAPGKNMPRHMKGMDGAGGMGMMNMMTAMMKPMDMEKMAPAECQAMMGENMAMMREME
jgi:ferric-dicitrate binding protein FerR (iron transport regulator)